MSDQRSYTFFSYAFFAAMLGMAGLPIYIHAPKFFVESYGISLSALGVALFALRLLDFVQDPLLGRLAERTLNLRSLPIWVAAVVMGLGMFGLFSMEAPFSPVLWFSLSLAAVFSGFSFLMIRFYANGVMRFGSEGQLHLARWRESGNLLGVCLAAIMPTLLIDITQTPFAIFAYLFCGIVFLAVLLMQREWHFTGAPAPSSKKQNTLSDPILRQMLVLAVLNTAPVAVSSTLFLFFVESRLMAPDMAGPLLIVFFLAAALSAPMWTFLADRFGAKRVLLLSMLAAIFVFLNAFFLSTGQTSRFAVICVASGATLGADLALLPAIFARHLAKTGARAEVAFGFWNFASKVSLALAAVTVLPLVEFFGFRSGVENTQSGLLALSFGYAALPCLLKILAIWRLLGLRFEDARG